MSDTNAFSETVRLFKAANAGDQGAIHALLVKYQDKIHKLARIRIGQKLRSKMDSMDIVQDAMLKALESVQRARDAGAAKIFMSEAEFLGWLYSIVKTRIYDEIRYYDAGKRHMTKEHHLDATHGHITVDRNVAARGNPAAEWEDMMLLESLLDSLDDEEKELIIDRDLYDYSFKEMSEKSGKTEDAVRMQYNRIKIKLSMLVKDDE